MLEEFEVGSVFLTETKEEVRVLFVDGRSIFYESCASKNRGIIDPRCAFSYWTKPEEKWFRVIFFHKESNHPYVYGPLFKSEQDFLDYECTEKEDYHWIKLEEISI